MATQEKDELNENGLTLKSFNQIREELVNEYKLIYGDDIVLDSNTQDGQLIDIFTQFNTDIRELANEIYNSFNPDLVRGALQDIRYRINNITRKGGTFTVVPIDITFNSRVELEGLDENINDVNAVAYGVSDDSGNTYFLENSVILTSDTYPATETLNFRYQNVGYIVPTIGSLVNPVTIVNGVTSLINNSVPIVVGENQETDEEFSIRRSKSTEIRGQNSTDAILSKIVALENIVDCKVYSYEEGSDDVPEHYIWVVIDDGGLVDNGAIANIIYENIGAAGTKGTIEEDIITASGNIFKARFDRVELEDLNLKFNLQKLSTDAHFDLNAIKETIANNSRFGINEIAETSSLTELINTCFNICGVTAGVPTNVQIKNSSTDWSSYIAAAGKNKKYVIKPENITITEVNI